MTVGSSLRRTKVPTPDSGPDDVDEIRLYWDPTADMDPFPSVSVVKNLREDAAKEDSLQGWRDRFDGKSKWGRPWYRDQKVFKGHRGTLIHYTILSALAEHATDTSNHSPDEDGHLDASGTTYFHEVGDGGWGYEEYRAEYHLKKWSTKAPSANTDEVPAPRNNAYDGEHAWDKAVRDMKWAARAFKEAVIDGSLDSSHFEWDDDPPERPHPLDPANVRAVEQFVCHDEAGYAGQYDLLYEHDGDTVLVDLKTSSGIRFDHKLQSTAYALAVEHCQDIEVDACEIIRLHPDSETVEFSHSSEWDRTVEGLQHEFLGLVDKCRVEYSETLNRAKEELSEHAQSSQQELESTADTEEAAAD